jgi:hypothetical protein
MWEWENYCIGTNRKDWDCTVFKGDTKCIFYYTYLKVSMIFVLNQVLGSIAVIVNDYCTLCAFHNPGLSKQ